MPDDEPVHQDRVRGLDHGAWVPLKVMYPYADVPVLQLSIPTHDPVRLLELGRRLRPLRDEGVLIVGSGFMTHGLPYLTHEQFFDNVVPTWSAEFDHWAAEALAAGDLDTLAAYRDRAPGMPYAHPTVEHFVPLFVDPGRGHRPEGPRSRRPSRASSSAWPSGRSRSPERTATTRESIAHGTALCLYGGTVHGQRGRFPRSH